MFALSALIALVGSVSAQTPFKSYTSPDTKFTISFPGTPNVSVPSKQDTDEGSAFTEQHYFVADDAAYVLFTADYPFAIDRAALKDIAKEQARSCGAPPATVQSDRNIQGRSALLFTVDCPKTEKRAAISLIIQAIADGNRVYRVMYGTSDKANRDRVDSFLISFRLN